MPRHCGVADAGAPARRALQWDGEDGPRPNMGNSIRKADSTFKDYIMPHALNMASRRTGVPLPGCTLRTPAPAGVAEARGNSSRAGQQTVQSFAGGQASAGRKMLSAELPTAA